MSQSPSTPINPWYREPWPWFIIGIIAVTVCWGMFQLTMTFRYADSVVVDDYYKNGKAINEDLTRDENAKALAISASIQIDELLGEVHVNVKGSEDSLPKQLTLSLMSPVFAEKDKIITLNRSVSGDYVGQLSESSTGVYYIQLETMDKHIPEVGYETGWRLSKKMDIAPGIAISLGG